MSINTDHQLREQMSHDNVVFPITYFHDELALLPNYEGPLHWHPEFEIATPNVNCWINTSVNAYHPSRASLPKVFSSVYNLDRSRLFTKISKLNVVIASSPS